MNNFMLGRLCFSVTGSNDFAELVREELASIRCDSACQPDLTFDWTESLATLDAPTLLPPYKITSCRFAAQTPELDYQVSLSEDCWKVVLRPTAAWRKANRRSSEPLRESWHRFRDWNYLSKNETLAKGFMYAVFDYVSQSVQLAKKQTYLHASSMTRDGRGVVIAGWGGVGKTTTALKLVTEHGWKYLSDDLGLVSDDGMLYRHPKRMQVYAYNLIDQPILRECLLHDRGVADRASWTLRRILRGVKKVRRRVSAEEFFGHEHVGVTARASDLFLMERAACSSIEVHALSLEEAVDRMTATLLHELSPFAEVNNACRAGGLQIGMPSIESTLAQTAQILRSAFRDVEPKIVRVPPATGPNALAEVMQRHLG